MAKYYLIGLGGTGARSIEAFVHLCAAGVFKEDSVSILEVDPDTYNGNISRSEGIIKQYQQIRKGLKFGGKGDEGIFVSDIILPNRDNLNWSLNLRRHTTVSEYFDLTGIKSNQNPDVKKLSDIADLLFTEEEKNMELDEGFRSHPSIGAAVMARISDELNSEPWRSIFEKAREQNNNGEGVYFFIIGSIFGGTGASGFPVVAKMIRDRVDNDREWQHKELCFIGGSLVLPYFTYKKPSEEEEKKSHGLYADPATFNFNTQLALQFYASYYGQTLPFTSLYVLGEENALAITNNKFANGTNAQRNKSHHIEFLTALAAIDFFSKDSKYLINEKNEQVRRKFVAGSNSRESINWNDVFYLREKPEDYYRLLYFTSVAFSYYKFFYEFVRDDRLFKEAFVAPWYMDNFRDVNFSEKEYESDMDSLKDYFKEFLRFIIEVHTHYQEDSSLRRLWLLNSKMLQDIVNNTQKEVGDSVNFDKLSYEVLEKLDFDHFDTLFLDNNGRAKKVTDSLTKIWELMCYEGSIKEKQDEHPLHKLLYLIYNASEKFFNEYYFLQSKGGEEK